MTRKERRECDVKLDVKGNPDFGHVDVTLEPGEKIIIESGAMVAMDPSLKMKSRFMGGFFKALIRRMLAGESLLVGEYEAAGKTASLTVSPVLPGQVVQRTLYGEELILQGGSFLACTPGIDLGLMFGGLTGLLGGEGLFFLRCKGRGELLVNTYGAMIEKEIDGRITVDTGHVVGWEPSLKWRLRKFGGWKSFFFSGEGLVMEFEGKGKIYLQTRSIGGLVSWLTLFCRG